ncbi:hypothetical protein GCM10023336_05060 [Streptomyces similanensis]|uniref:Uncharacterized protein n=1 Tax=Streptomyces similanensis TaxID=1274988 RepID=A0ABP9JV29_9ACTN
MVTTITERRNQASLGVGGQTRPNQWTLRKSVSRTATRHRCPAPGDEPAAGPRAAPDRQPLDENAAASVRAYAADQRARVDVLASVLEDIAEHGYPAARLSTSVE